MAVDNHVDAVNLGIRQVHQAHDRRDTHGPGQDRDVGVTRTQNRDQAHQFAVRHFAEHGGGQLFTDQDGVVGVDQVGGAVFLQVGQQTATKITYVRGTLAQVGVVHQLETVDVIG